MRHRRLYLIFIVIAAAILNTGLQQLQFWLLEWPLYLDSVFTIVVGIFFGWLPGAITGILTNLFMEVLIDFSGANWPFAVVNMATGIISGLLAVDKEKYWTLQRQILMILSLTAANSLLGAYIVNVVFGGILGDNVDILVSALIMMGRSTALSTLLARVPINFVDKGLPVLLIYIIHRVYIRNKTGPEIIGKGFTKRKSKS